MQKLPLNRLSPKIIALDLDDTLLNSDLKISLKTVHALQCAAYKKIYVVLCSGRTENAILPYVRTLNIAGCESGRYIIAGNGSSIYDLHKRETIFSRKVDGEVLRIAKETADEMGFPCQVYSPDTIFANVDNDYTRMDAKLCKLSLKIVPDFDAFLKQGHSKMLIPGDPEKIKVLHEALKEKLGDKAVIFISKPYFLEIMPPHCGKGEALEYLCEHLGISMSDAMSFGDSMNDETMITMAKHSVAMINGLDYIKNEAAYITEKTNNEDGVGQFLERFVL